MGHAKRKNVAKRTTGSSQLLTAQHAAARHFANTVPTGTLPCIAKLASADPADREDGCLDASHLSQNASNLPSLLENNIPQHLAVCLADEEIHVRTAAAAAARNILLQMSVHGSDNGASVGAYLTADLCALLATKLSEAFTLLLSPGSDVTQSNGQPLTEAHLQAVSKGSLAGDQEEVEAFETMRDAAFANVIEFIQLVGVVADCSEDATMYFSDVSKCAVLPVLASAIEIGLDPNFCATLNRSRGLELSVSSANVHTQSASAVGGDQLASVAAETLHLIARENELLAAFLSTGLTPSQQQLLNDITVNTPTSPSLLLVSLYLLSALLGTSPTMDNASRSVGSISRALGTLPFAEWRKVLPLLTEGCDMTEEVRKASVQQSLDRFRALQLASDILGEMIGVVCQSHDDSLEDEEAFAANPNSSVIITTGLLTQLLAILTDIFSPQDPVLQKALREVTDNAEVSAIQHAFASVEVGIFGVVSSLLHLLPMAAMGPTSVVWRTCVTVLTARHELVSESIGCPEGPLPSHAQLILQIESLTEMCWTVLRKDGASGHPSVELQPSDLDLFTRIAWEGYVSTATIVFVVSVVGCIGTRVRTEQTHTACGRFCVAVINHALGGTKDENNANSKEENMDVAVEGANILMDLFCDEDFDATVYMPLNIHSTLREMLPAVQKYVASFGRKRSPKKDHFSEVSENLAAFIKYKHQHGCK